MSHMVIYRGSDGKPGYHQTDDIHDAVGFVESMRNDKGVEQARIFRLEEVVFEYKPYYRVELSPAVLEAEEKVEAIDPVAEDAEIESGETSDSDDVDGDESDEESDDNTEEASDDDVEATKKGLFGR